LSKIIEQWAGHYLGGGSDKLWAGAYTQDGQFLSKWGRRGAALQKGEKPVADQAAAKKVFEKKRNEKISEGYQAVPFDNSTYGISSFDPALAGVTAAAPSTVGGSNADGTDPTTAANLTTMPAATTSCYATSHVMPLELAELEAALAEAACGVSEKVNGERCVVACEGLGQPVRAYNRRGSEVSNAPHAALALAKLGCQFVIDGERLTGDKGGQYVAFDLLEWQGENLREWPYKERIATLEQALTHSGLIALAAATIVVTTTTLSAGGAASGLHLLVAEVDYARAREVVTQIQQAGGVGIIVRTLSAPYQAGDTRYVRKFKFLADLDAIVIGTRPGIATGSATLGLIRPSDGAIIEVGNVRSGLNDNDLCRLAEMLAQGEIPVLKVSYLPVRTVGIKLVEPKTSIRELRTDKLAHECTTEQLGQAKAAMVTAARPVKVKQNN